MNDYLVLKIWNHVAVVIQLGVVKIKCVIIKKLVCMKYIFIIGNHSFSYDVSYYDLELFSLSPPGI